MSAFAEIKKVFEADAAKRHAAGLPLEQAKLIALNQLVRDARRGELDAEAVTQLVIEQEVAHGRSSQGASAHAKALLDGKSSDWAKRDFGYAKGRVRSQPRPGRNDITPESLGSDYLSHFANQIGAPK